MENAQDATVHGHAELQGRTPATCKICGRPLHVGDKDKPAADPDSACHQCGQECVHRLLAPFRNYADADEELVSTADSLDDRARAALQRAKALHYQFVRRMKKDHDWKLLKAAAVGMWPSFEKDDVQIANQIGNWLETWEAREIRFAQDDEQEKHIKLRYRTLSVSSAIARLGEFVGDRLNSSARGLTDDGHGASESVPPDDTHADTSRKTEKEHPTRERRHNQHSLACIRRYKNERKSNPTVSMRSVVKAYSEESGASFSYQWTRRCYAAGNSGIGVSDWPHPERNMFSSPVMQPRYTASAVSHLYSSGCAANHSSTKLFSLTKQTSHGPSLRGFRAIDPGSPVGTSAGVRRRLPRRTGFRLYQTPACEAG